MPLCRGRRWDADVAPDPSPVGKDLGNCAREQRRLPHGERYDAHGDGATDQDDPDSPGERNEQFSNKAGVDH
jgi:hypothetical protein